jgi:hypothetical protein
MGIGPERLFGAEPDDDAVSDLLQFVANRAVSVLSGWRRPN